MNNTKIGGHSGARSLVVWDPLVRLVHWGLVLTILLNSTIIDDDSNLHVWIGYIAAGLVAIRLFWGVFGTRNAKFSTFPPNPVSAIRHLKAILRRDSTIHLSHNPLGALMAYNLWSTIIVLAITGYMMGTLRYFGVEWVEEVHEIAFSWLLASIALHVAGVIFDTWRSGVPLVKAMIFGRKQIPEERTIK